MPPLNNLPALEVSTAATRTLPVTSGYVSGQQTRKRRTLPLAAEAARTSLAQPAVAMFVCMTVESEDAKMTGATRSLSRRLLGLNLYQDA